ncbi:ATP-binding protein [Emticicia sp. W12TSBA100-4]|uniref:ATP-binding protein n=1 Tax=Emticicia sp. W12TSBA100-4 TaxID=3160965 RepID=UPI00330656FC
MIERNIAKAISELMLVYPVIALTGPRQSGKTTLLKSMFKDYRYISLENPDNRFFAEQDPNGFLELYNQKVIFDEVQRVPSLFSYIQTLVDESKTMGQFILSGSQNFSLMKNITQSLAGRVALFKLFPFDFEELNSHNLLTPDYSSMLVRGCYPALYDRPMPTTPFYANYIETYVERDLSELLNIKDIRLFRTFLKLCAGRIGQQLNLTNLANETGISIPTVKSWLSILESSYITYQLPPFFNNFNKRLVKSTKLYFYDTGLACYLLGIKSEKSIQESEFKGALFENMVINEYIKQNYHHGLYREFYYWRDSNGHEVDLLVSNETTYDVVEIKATKTILPKLFDGLDLLKNIGKETINRKILVYGGTESQNRSNYKIWAWNSIKIDF